MMIIKIFFMFSKYVQDDYKIFFMFPRYIEYDYKNILHAPWICRVGLYKYSSCSLDIYRMIMKILFMSTKYVKDDYKNILHIL